MSDLPLKRVSKISGLMLTGLTLVGLLLWGGLQKSAKTSPSPPSSGDSVSRHIRYSFTLHNSSSRVLDSAQFWAYAPVKQTATQRCVNIEASHPFQLITDTLGNQILHFRFHEIPPYGTKIVTIRADVNLTVNPVPIPADDPQPFLRAARGIESDDPRIIGLAAQFQAPTPAATAEKIFNWVADHVQYTGFSGRDRGALFALQNAEGDCTEYMSLLVALCRASAIPSRGVGGYVCHQDTVLKPDGYHNWAEIWIDGTWKQADPQNRVFTDGGSRYIAMRIIGDNSATAPQGFDRFRFSGKGLRVKMNG